MKLRFLLLCGLFFLFGSTAHAQTPVVGGSCPAAGQTGITAAGTPVICTQPSGGGALVWTATGGSSGGSSGSLPFTYTNVSDYFQRPDSSTLGPNWIGEVGNISQSPLTLSGNAVVPTGLTTNSAAIWGATSFAPNQFAEGVINLPGGGSGTIGLVVRGNPGDSYYRAVASLGTPGTVKIDKVDAGAFTLLTTATPTVSNGMIMRFEISGSNMTVYLNGTSVATTSDSDLAVGSPGIAGFLGSASPAPNLTNWRGGDLVWTRQGTVIAANQTNTDGQGNQEPDVIHEGNCQVVAGSSCFKMWFSDGWTTCNIYYAESTDAVHWTVYSGGAVIPGGCHSWVMPNPSGGYVGYITNLNATSGYDRWTSANGVTGWTLANSNVVPLGGAGSFDSTAHFNPQVWIQNGTWYMVYEANGFAIGVIMLATSPDGITWTKYNGNPILTPSNPNLGVPFIGGPEVHIAGSTYYMIAHTCKPLSGITCNSGIPSDIILFSAPSIFGPWLPSSKNLILRRELADEGPGLTTGQVADPNLLEYNGTTYFFMDGITTQSSGQIHINLRTIAQPLANVLSGSIGNLTVPTFNNRNGPITLSPGDVPTTLGVTNASAATSERSETAADTNLVTLTPPATPGKYRLSFTLDVSAANTATLGWTATWKDSNSTAQSPTNLPLFQQGTAAPALTFTTSVAGNYNGSQDITIDNTGTNIVIKLTFTGTSFAGKASASIERIF